MRYAGVDSGAQPLSGHASLYANRRNQVGRSSHEDPEDHLVGRNGEHRQQLHQPIAARYRRSTLIEDGR
jgi:hypothetical protein